MASELVSFIDNIKSNKQIVSFDETSIKQTVVMKLLFLLGWDIFDVSEVSPNHTVGKHQIDYSLKIKNKSKVFVNVKEAGTPLDKYQKELFKPAAMEDVEFSVLTNGMIWWFFLTLGKKNLEQKQICSLDFSSQSSDDIAKQLKEFLEKDRIAKGQALESAEKRLKKRYQKLIEETLPKAWHQIISAPPELLVDLLRETAEKICGFSPERKTALKFLSEDLVKSRHPGTAAPAEKHPTPDAKANGPQGPAASKEITKPVSRGYDDKSISAFSFKKKNYKIKAWGDLVLKLCEVLNSEYKQDVEKLLWHSVGDKYYFSRDASELRFPESIKGTDIYAQTIRNSNEAVNAAHSILSFFGYSKDDFSITTKEV